MFSPESWSIYDTRSGFRVFNGSFVSEAAASERLQSWRARPTMIPAGLQAKDLKHYQVGRVV